MAVADDLMDIDLAPSLRKRNQRVWVIMWAAFFLVALGAVIKGVVATATHSAHVMTIGGFALAAWGLLFLLIGVRTMIWEKAGEIIRPIDKSSPPGVT